VPEGNNHRLALGLDGCRLAHGTASAHTALLLAFAAEQNHADGIRHRVANKCYQTKINQKTHRFQNLPVPYTSIITEPLSHKTDSADAAAGLLKICRNCNSLVALLPVFCYTVRERYFFEKR
jgi:hypothetical protein